MICSADQFLSYLNKSNCLILLCNRLNKFYYIHYLMAEPDGIILVGFVSLIINPSKHGIGH